MLLTYSLRTLACKWSGYSTWLFVLLMDSYDDVDGLWFYVIFYMHIDRCYWRVSLSVQDTWRIVDVEGINGPPWTSHWFREWIVLVWVFHLCICDIWSIIAWFCIWIIDNVSLMDAGWRFLANLTHIRSKGAMHIDKILRERCGNVHVTTY